MRAIMQLKDYTIDKLCFKLNPHSYMSPALEDMCTSDDYFFDYLIFKAEESETNYLMEFTIRCNNPQDIPEDVTYAFELVLKGIFEFDNQTDNETIDRMLFNNGISILYGIARGVIAQVSGHTAKGKIVLPTVNFYEYFNPQKNKLIQ